MEQSELAGLVGHRFPGGSFTIEPYEDWLMRDVLRAPQGDGVHAHPIWGFAAPQASMGISIDELFELCGSSAVDGPLLGDTDVESTRPLLLADEYTVSGGIVSAVRKSGRRAGTFDLVHFSVESRDRNSAVCGRLTNSFVFPRTGT